MGLLTFTVAGSVVLLPKAASRIIEAGACMVLIVGIVLAFLCRAPLVAIGLAISGLLTLGLLFRRVERRVHPGSMYPRVPSSFYILALGLVSVLPSIAVGSVAVILAARYTIAGLVGGLFLGFGLSLVALWLAVAIRLHREARDLEPEERSIDRAGTPPVE